MSGTEGTPRTHPCGDDVAAYALGALDPVEVPAFQRHLEQCAVCRDELAAFEQVVSELPLAAEQHRAPLTLRKRVLRAVEDERKVDSAAERRRTRPRRSWLSIPRPALALGAVVLLAAIVVGALQIGSGSSAHVYNAMVSGSAGSAQVRVSDGHAELVVRNFAAPPPGKIYEVWLRRPNGQPQPTSALFSVTATGNGDVDVPGNLKGVSQVLVTPEPAGGSKVPTHTPVITADLA
jgi:anti-sigma-K factor RskA